jgi:hypothetical protein
MIRAYWRHAPLFLKITTVTAVALVALQIVLLVISRGALFVVGNLVISLLCAAWCTYLALSHGGDEYDRLNR